MLSIEKIRNKVILLERSSKSFLIIFSDIFFVNLNFMISYFILDFFYLNNVNLYIKDFPNFSLLLNFNILEIVISSSIIIFLLYLLNAYKSFFRALGPLNIIGFPRIFCTFVFAFLLFFILILKNFYFVEALKVFWMQLIYIIFYFLIFRTFIYIFLSKKSKSEYIPVVIYGAGQAGRETAAALSQSKKYKIIGFIDDNEKLKNYEIIGIKVLGNHQKIIGLKKDYPNLLVMISMINISFNQRRKIISLLEPIEVSVKTIPASFGSLETKFSIENISAEDLIGRRDTSINNNFDHACIKNKNVLISGAGGSIGSELAIQVAKLEPKKLILLDSSEFNLYELSNKLKNFKNYNSMDFVLNNIQSKNFMNEIIIEEKINNIFHAAAYKHVPILQNKLNFLSALENNFFSTYNLCRAAYENKVENFTFISTDKAVNPTNIMGASKRLGELCLQGFQEIDGNSTCFSVVRFGNVINSSGSVVPLFWNQISSGGPVTVTDENVNRFFMTISEASSLVIHSNAMSEGGEIFLLDMGKPLKIKNLAERMIRLSGNTVAAEGSKNGIKISYTGLRPGEKLFEELLLSNNPIETSHPKIKKGLEKKHDLEELYSLKQELKLLFEIKSFVKIEKLISKYVDGYVKYEN